MSWGPKQTIEEGFDRFVIKNKDGCWDWSGCCPKNPGYGQFRTGMRLIRAHRASWIIHNGEIPKGKNVIHKCDNRRCSNPDHLYLGTQQDNKNDTITRKRTTQFGETHLNAVLSMINVIFISELCKLGVMDNVVANIFNVTKSHIGRIRRKNAWKYVWKELS